MKVYFQRKLLIFKLEKKNNLLCSISSTIVVITSIQLSRISQLGLCMCLCNAGKSILKSEFFVLSAKSDISGVNNFKMANFTRRRV